MIGIYKITNKKNNKVYIGQSIDIFRRWKDHESKLIKNIHENYLLQNDYNKYNDIDNFIFEVLCTCNKDELDDKEKYYIKEYNSLDKDTGYNIRTEGIYIENIEKYDFIYKDLMQTDKTDYIIYKNIINDFDDNQAFLSIYATLKTQFFFPCFNYCVFTINELVKLLNSSATTQRKTIYDFLDYCNERNIINIYKYNFYIEGDESIKLPVKKLDLNTLYILKFNEEENGDKHYIDNIKFKKLLKYLSDNPSNGFMKYLFLKAYIIISCGITYSQISVKDETLINYYNIMKDVIK